MNPTLNHFQITYFRSLPRPEVDNYHDACKVLHKASGEFVVSDSEPYIFNNKCKAFEELFNKLGFEHRFLSNIVTQPDTIDFKINFKST